MNPVAILGASLLAASGDPTALRVYDLADRSFAFTGRELPAPESFTVLQHGPIEVLVGPAEPFPAPRPMTVIGAKGTCVTTAGSTRLVMRRSEPAQVPDEPWREALALDGCDLGIRDGQWLWPPDRIAFPGEIPAARWQNAELIHGFVRSSCATRPRAACVDFVLAFPHTSSRFELRGRGADARARDRAVLRRARASLARHNAIQRGELVVAARIHAGDDMLFVLSQYGDVDFAIVDAEGATLLARDPNHERWRRPHDGW